MEVTIAEDRLKELLKMAVVEVLKERGDLVREIVEEALKERGDLLREIFEEALEDVALCRAIEEGESSERVSRDHVFSLLKGEA